MVKIFPTNQIFTNVDLQVDSKVVSIVSIIIYFNKFYYNSKKTICGIWWSCIIKILWMCIFVNFKNFFLIFSVIFPYIIFSLPKLFTLLNLTMKLLVVYNTYDDKSLLFFLVINVYFLLWWNSYYFCLTPDTHTHIYIYIYIYIYRFLSTDRLFCCITTLQCG